MNIRGNLKKIGITIISVFIFYLLGRYTKIDTGINITYIYLQYPFLCIISIMYGPVVGGIVGILGHMLIDIAESSKIWLSWAMGTGIVGILLGIIAQKWKMKNKPEADAKNYRRTRLKNALIILGINFIAFLLVAPVLDVIIYKYTIADAFTRGFFIAFSDGLTAAIVTDLVFSSVKHTIVRRILSVLTLVDALVLVSYGNRNVGSILLYVITIIFGLYLFFYDWWNKKSKYKIIQIGKGLVFWGLIIYACEILFLAIFAYANKPSGDENVAIVLGAGLEDTKPSRILQYRLDAAYDWYMENPDRIIITSGGQGEDEVIAEGHAMRNYLILKGVNPANIYAECKSRTTYENFKFSEELINENEIDISSNIVIVTNNFHCLRATGYAKEVGLNNVKSLAAPTPAFGIIPNYLREGLAFIKYLL